MTTRSLRSLLPVLPIGIAVILGSLSVPRRAEADPATEDQAEKMSRCATRLYASMVGESASASALASGRPQADFDALAKDPRFVERFSRFINAQFNREPGATPSEDAPYYMAKFVLEGGKPWTDMFVGKYDVAPANGGNANAEAAVTDDPDGLGYFRSRAWSVRYAGNELAGIRIVTAYRMMQNTIGLVLEATTNAPEADISANGRKSAACAVCHYQPWFALDSVATVLGTVTRNNNNVTFNAPTGGAQQILGGVSVSNDAELVQALVTNEAFDVNACRLAYKYLYGRNELSCDGPVFDQCVDAFKKDKQIVSALRVVATDPNFCE